MIQPMINMASQSVWPGLIITSATIKMIVNRQPIAFFYKLPSCGALLWDRRHRSPWSNTFPL